MRVCLVALGIAVVACGALTGAPETSGPADAGGTDAAPDSAPDHEDGAVDAGALAADAGDAARSVGEQYFVRSLYPSVQPTCAGCHVAGESGPVFFGTDAASTYVLFEQAGYAAKTNNRFLQKGAHEGPALTPTQVTLFNAWLALEP